MPPDQDGAVVHLGRSEGAHSRAWRDPALMASERMTRYSPYGLYRDSAVAEYELRDEARRRLAGCGRAPLDKPGSCFGVAIEVSPMDNDTNVSAVCRCVRTRPLMLEIRTSWCPRICRKS